MAGGRQGVDRMIEILSEEIVRTMKLLQVTTLDELEPKHVTQLTRFSTCGLAAQASETEKNEPVPSRFGRAPP